MKRSRFSETQIVGILKEADSGITVREVCRTHGISDATYYKWKSKYGGLDASAVKRLRELETENSQLKRMYAELSLENQALKDLIAKKLSGHRSVGTRSGIWWPNTRCRFGKHERRWGCLERRGTNRPTIVLRGTAQWWKPYWQ